MKDGTQVIIRPIRPEDEPLMVKFHGTLSDRTVYLRYFTSMSLARRTTHERLAHICHADYQCEIVLVAGYKDPQTGDSQILAVGRLNKLQVKGSAELAVLVSDEYQRKGLGTELLRRLIEVARAEHLHRLVAEMLRDNVAIQSILKGLGFRLRSLNDVRALQATLEL